MEATRAKNLKNILFGIYAGLAIALGGFLNIVSNSYFGGVGKIIGSLLFPVGLTLVCFLSLNLFTGKIGYLFDNKKNGYIKFLVIVYLGNLIGSLIFGFLALAIFKNVEPIYEKVTAIASNKTNISDFVGGLKLLAGGVLCGALVYLAVFFYKTFKNVIMKVVGIFVPIALFVYLGFDHCVANMFYFTFAFSFANPLSYLNIALATIGNSIGAIALNSLIKSIKTMFGKKKINE